MNWTRMWSQSVKSGDALAILTLGAIMTLYNRTKSYMLDIGIPMSIGNASTK